MTAPKHQADENQVIALLERWIESSSSDEGHAWLREKREAVAGGAADWQFYTAFSAVPQRIGKRDLRLSASDLRDARAVRRGWHPVEWSADQAARAVIVLSYPADDRDRYVRALEQLFDTADARESVALYRSLPLLPYPEAFRARAAEGVRSNMTSVFNAVAHHNPYPAEYLDEAAWNQIVLKALFVGSPIGPIVGLDDRTNPTLARMLVDYAHERWAAKRDVSPELWRPVSPFAEHYLEELALVLDSADEVEREAAALALSHSDAQEARDLLSNRPDLQARIRSGELTWESLASGKIPT